MLKLIFIPIWLLNFILVCYNNANIAKLVGFFAHCCFEQSSYTTFDVVVDKEHKRIDKVFAFCVVLMIFFSPFAGYFLDMLQ